MSVEERISGYESSLGELRRAIERDDVEIARILDQTVASAFDEILASKPDDPQERLSLVCFLLDQVCPPKSRTLLQTRVVDKIKSLAA